MGSGTTLSLRSSLRAGAMLDSSLSSQDLSTVDKRFNT